MTTFSVVFGLNETPGHRFDEYHPGDDLRWVGPIELEADDAVDILDVAWEAGNKEGPNADLYPRTQRSVSVGDIVRVDGDAFDHVVDRFGWITIDRVDDFRYGEEKPRLA